MLLMVLFRLYAELQCRAGDHPQGGGGRGEEEGVHTYPGDPTNLALLTKVCQDMYMYSHLFRKL